MGRTRILVGLGVVALVLVVQVAWGTIPSPSGTITGCYQKSTGALRLVDSSIGCNSGTEGVLQWNERPTVLNVTVPMSTTRDISESVQLYTGNSGLLLFYQCSSLSSGKFGFLQFDAGSTGQNTLSFMALEPTPINSAANSHFVTSRYPEVGSATAPGMDGTYHAAGTYIAQIVVGGNAILVTVVFAVTIDFTAQTCNFAGTIT
jgi:hypothetical protein